MEIYKVYFRNKENWRLWYLQRQKWLRLWARILLQSQETVFQELLQIFAKWKILNLLNELSNICKKTEDMTISTKYYYKILSNFEVDDLRRKHAYLYEYANCPEHHLWKLFTHLDFQERLIKRVEFDIFDIDFAVPRNL